MTWTDTPPAVPGWYWYRCDPSESAVMVRVAIDRYGVTVCRDDEDYELAEWIKGDAGPQWAGPIPQPEEPPR